jgi:hypothetical protein
LLTLRRDSVEVICRQMLRARRVTRAGDTNFLSNHSDGKQVDRFRFK